MLELEQAIEVLMKMARPPEDTEEIPLLQASGRVLAEDIKAAFDQPPFPRSPLDGYAVRGQDTEGASRLTPVVLNVIGKIYAGQVFEGTVGPGQAVRLMTGAPIPSGADTVIRQEDTDYVEKAMTTDTVTVYQGSKAWKNYCFAGEDYRRGNQLLEKDVLLNGGRIGIIAGTGTDRVSVYKEPTITVISTGDEVIAPGQELLPGKIYDTNRYMLVGRLQDLGFDRVKSFHCEDRPDGMEARIREAAKTSSLIITTGGVSVGEKDIMHQVMEDLEGEKLFWRVNLKPGAPTLAFMYGKTLVICLTGNPFGAAANFELLIRPVLAKLGRNPDLVSRQRHALMHNDSPKHGGVRRFIRGRFDYEKEEVTVLAGGHVSGTLSPLASSNCLVEIPEDGTGKAGETVRIYML